MNAHVKKQYTDILYDKKDRVATITINRPQSYNSVTQHSVEELTDAFKRQLDILGKHFEINHMLHICKFL